MTQHLLVLLLVCGCAAVVIWQGCKTLTLRGRGKLGACCAKGCDAAEKHDETAKPASGGGRVHFMPVETLGRRR